ncbi:MAG: DALR anticodon-binding domain-containing protein, partial [Anaerolineae bacterium]
RQRGVLTDQGIRFDLADAVLAAQGDNPYQAYKTMLELTPWIAKPEWPALLASYARCVRITRNLGEVYMANPTYFNEPAARSLYEAYRQSVEHLHETRDVATLMAELTTLKPVIDRFFEDILVMAEDANLREARLGLLQGISRLTEGIVDLSYVEGF